MNTAAADKVRGQVPRNFPITKIMRELLIGEIWWMKGKAGGLVEEEVGGGGGAHIQF